MISHLRHQCTSILSVIVIAMAAGLASCDSVIYDDLDPCGVKLRFTYCYNMEFANAFPSQVDCLTVYIYDSAGRLVDTRTETNTTLLSNENWRMEVVHERGSYIYTPGTYTVVAYGGMAPEHSSFHFVNPVNLGSSMTDLGVAMDGTCYNVTPGVSLHPLFYGTGTFEVKAKDDTATEETYTIDMMKDTNNLRILLQHVDGTPVNDADFTYTLTADNTTMDCDNSLVVTETVTYNPWTRGQATSGVLPSGEESVLAFAEFSTGRFVNGNNVTLTISRASDGGTVLRIPLINYLLLLKSQEFEKMGSQEFLDRESRWNMIFFLDNRGGNDSWLQTTIVINDWVVRINDIDM